jgi:hypothetical protein
VKPYPSLYCAPARGPPSQVLRAFIDTTWIDETLIALFAQAHSCRAREMA